MDTKLQHLMPREAWEMLKSNPRAVLIDIRSTPEVRFVGYPQGSVHIPWIDEPEWTVNPHFVRQVRELMLGGVMCDGVDGCAPILLICRSGKRSVDAGWELIRQGLRQVYNVLDGFEGDLDEHRHRNSEGGWRVEGLPWEQH